MPNPYDEEEELPVDEQGLAVPSPVLDMSQIESPPDPMTILPPAPISLPQTSAEKLRSYLDEKYAGDIKDARSQRGTSNLLASIGRGLNTISNSVGAKTNNEGYDAMDKQGEQGVSDVQGDYKIGSANQAKLQDYLRRISADKVRANNFDSLDKWRNSRAATEDQRAKDLARLGEDRNKTYADRTAALSKMGESRLGLQEKGLGLRERGLGLREGSQAAQAAGKFVNDKVMITTNTQLQGLEKGIGLLDAIDAGKLPFSTTMKADLEKDFMQGLTSSGSGSLGQLERVEFTPAVAKYQHILDYMQGYQGDIQAPEFKQQLRTQFQELRKEIQNIQDRRAEKLEKSYGTAYSGNPLAMKAIKENRENNRAPVEAHPQANEALDWAKAHPDDPRAAAILKKLGVQ